MKRILSLIIISFVLNSAKSQEIKDAVRYSQDNLTGTARFRAMGGAFGALGGDLSSININPAGTAIFSNNQIGFTLNNTNFSNKSDYFGNRTNESENSFLINQVGIVFVFRNEDYNSDWKKFSFAVNYEKNNNFNNTLFFKGTNPTQSIDSYFLAHADGIPLSNLSDSYYEDLKYTSQQAFLGYHANVIAPSSTNANNTTYTSNVPAVGNYYHENRIETKGYNGKVSFNASTYYKDKFYIGINLNSHFVEYHQNSSFYEDNDAPLTSGLTVSRLRFDNNLYTYGGGFSFQIGTITKVTQNLRLGLAFESPTWYSLNDQVSQKLSVVRESTTDTSTNNVDPRITMLYDLYKLQTPSKWTGSFAYIFNKKGLLSIDYAIKDYSDTRFRPSSDSYFLDLNSTMSKTLSATGELRIGAEYRIKRWNIRGGYRQEQSPYKDKTTIGDLTAFSAGLGYNLDGIRIDLAYTTLERNTKQNFFDKGFTGGSSINTRNDVIVASVVFEL